jgi:hypothetical protein
VRLVDRLLGRDEVHIVVFVFSIFGNGVQARGDVFVHGVILVLVRRRRFRLALRCRLGLGRGLGRDGARGGLARGGAWLLRGRGLLLLRVLLVVIVVVGRALTRTRRRLSLGLSGASAPAAGVLELEARVLVRITERSAEVFACTCVGRDAFLPRRKYLVDEISGGK